MLQQDLSCDHLEGAAAAAAVVAAAVAAVVAVAVDAAAAAAVDVAVAPLKRVFTGGVRFRAVKLDRVELRNGSL
jgi:hypothetical protein